MTKTGYVSPYEARPFVIGWLFQRGVLPREVI